MEEIDSWPHVCELSDCERHHLKCCFEEELRELKPYVEREILESPAAKNQKQLDSDSSAITPQDDFRRFVNEPSYTKECEEFHQQVDVVRVAIQERLNLKSESSYRLLIKEMGIGLVKGIAQRNWDLKNYKFLSEIDIICMFKICYLTYCSGEFYGFNSVTPQLPNVYVPAVKTSRVDDMLMVKNALRDCTPLEGKAKCHLNKGLLSWERSNVENFLVCELLKDTRILELKESVPTPDPIEVIGSILDDVVSCLSHVVWSRREQVYHVHCSVFSPQLLRTLCLLLFDENLSFEIGFKEDWEDDLETNAGHIKFLFGVAWAGSFAEEVIEVVIYADYIRRHKGHNFIEVCHILLALGHTRMVDAVRGAIRDAGLNFLYEYKAEYPIYDFYIIAKDIASYIGDGMVGVKHLVLAILWEGGKLIAGKEKEILKDFDPCSWSEFSEKVYVKSFLEVETENRDI
ncbi:hypothetical protein SLEP1_g4002 [Rubroshorea leprosula]|uniref:Uncharacterized protein n=1 Tax=Rubroshorea leprosula TaxID=152421 RepID=A0AAV5HXS3_9ROSI|nr:hypothetical protein SLEP1_g4002 [Rubroshorea leprosula]